MQTAEERITTVEAAKRLGVSRQHIFQLVKDRRLPAIRVGRDWLIAPTDLILVTGLKKTGRPRADAKQVKPAVIAEPKAARGARGVANKGKKGKPIHRQRSAK